MKPKETYISDKYKYEDYLELDFNINSTTKVWDKAIDIFKSRIESRHFYAIKKLMNKRNKKEMIKCGFAIMTLECSLIDTFARFRYAPNKQRRRFVNFLKDFLLDGPNAETDAVTIYKNIRCGLVHSGATDHMCGLTYGLKNLITIKDDGGISLDIIEMNERLKNYLKDYIKILKNTNEIEVRENFVNTMNIICKP